jgi:predicted DNA-binding WGR domain protein
MVNSNTVTLINIDPVENRRKFYAVTVAGRNVHLHWGRIGTTGQRKVETLYDNTAAADFARDKIYSKLDHGYERVAV